MLVDSDGKCMGVELPACECGGPLTTHHQFAAVALVWHVRVVLMCGRPHGASSSIARLMGGTSRDHQCNFSAHSRLDKTPQCRPSEDTLRALLLDALASITR